MPTEEEIGFKRISSNDKRLDKEVEIKEGLVDAFQNLPPTPGGWRPTLPEIALNEIGPKDATKLEEAFSKEEV